MTPGRKQPLPLPVPGHRRSDRIFPLELAMPRLQAASGEADEPEILQRVRSGAPPGRRGAYSRLITEEITPAPNPLSMFTTATVGAQEFSIPSSAATPPKPAP